MKIKAMIPVRSGSQRVKNKNTRPFAGSSLLEIKINQLKQINVLDGIVVNSNDDTMLDIARKMGCETVKRDQYYATDVINNRELCEYLVKSTNADVVMYINVTCPLIKTETIEKAIHTYKNVISQYDALTTVTEVKEFLYCGSRALNFNPQNKPRSQDLPSDYIYLNNALFIISQDVMKKTRNITGDKPFFFKVDSAEAIDIDNEIDFEFAEFMYKKINGII
ncbi:hypothetical protein FACS189437_00110 [Bacteroidia bacterium]|nr:hypothetical protein FACS189437_00110 [Bacteroidia bacterium]